MTAERPPDGAGRAVVLLSQVLADEINAGYQGMHDVEVRARRARGKLAASRASAPKKPPAFLRLDPADDRVLVVNRERARQGAHELIMAKRSRAGRRITAAHDQRPLRRTRKAVDDVLIVMTTRFDDAGATTFSVKKRVLELWRATCKNNLSSSPVSFGSPKISRGQTGTRGWRHEWSGRATPGLASARPAHAHTDSNVSAASASEAPALEATRRRRPRPRAAVPRHRVDRRGRVEPVPAVLTRVLTR